MNLSTRMLGLLVAILALLASSCSSAGDSTASKERPAPPQPAAAPPPAHGSSPASPAPLERPLPPYHDTAAGAEPFPELMPVERYRDYPVVARAYEVAQRIPGVVAQQPCFCYCDKFGHKSLQIGRASCRERV